MIFGSTNDQGRNRRQRFRRIFMLVAVALFVLSGPSQALPTRLVIALDGVAYRDMQALQAGVARTNFWGHVRRLRAFTAEEGYHPVSRMISTFPSASDVAWTDIFGDHPLPGYQRTYFCDAANSMIVLNGITSTVEHERQMDWQAQNGLIRALGYMFPVHTFRYEMKGMEIYWEKSRNENNFYAYLRASDDAQHLDRDIFSLLCELDRKLQKLRARYLAQTGRELEIVILSDHGHNHAGRGIRVSEAAFLQHAGYHVGTAINGPKDVVLPIVGIESWVEVHCTPSETEKLTQLLCQLKGADILAAVIPDQTNRFLVMNAKGEQADIQWHPAQNTYRYSIVKGDPLNYQPVLDFLAHNHQLDTAGFASGDDWMAATMTNHFPLALERIVRGLTRGALNPATIIISLDNRYVNDNWLTDKGSLLVTCGSTHGGLDDICSDGILLSNFAPTRDTSTARVAGQFDNFPRVKNFRAAEAGAEWVTQKEQLLTRIARAPFDGPSQQLRDGGVYLRVWSPQLAGLDAGVPLTVTIAGTKRYSTAPKPQPIIFDWPLAFPENSANERIYALPADLKLKPHTEYKISGWLSGQSKSDRLFDFTFNTDPSGLPAAY